MVGYFKSVYSEQGATFFHFFYKCVSNIPMISQIMIPTRSEDIGDVTVNKHDYSFYKINTGTQTALKKDTKILSI